MLTSYCQLGNLRLLIDNRQELHDRIGETLNVLDDIACEDHRGMFADTQTLAWTSTKFKSRKVLISSDVLQHIQDYLCLNYQVLAEKWPINLTTEVTEVDGVSVGRAIYTSFQHQHRNSFIILELQRNQYFAARIQQIFYHAHQHPHDPHLSVSEIYTSVDLLNPLDTDVLPDWYRQFKMGWLCCDPSNPSTPTPVQVTVPLKYAVSHCVWTPFEINNHAILHVLPVPKVRISFTC